MKERTKENLALWTLRYRTIRGIPFSFKGHKYLSGIYQDKHPFIVIRKSAQCGVSEWLINSALWLADHHRYNSTVVFPGDPEVSDFINGRVNPAIQDCDYLRSLVSVTDNIGLKKVRKAFIYFRGSRKPHKLKTIDSDCILYDELDELTEGTLARGEKRLGHSNLKWQRAVSTPTYPEEGIDKLYIESDQCKWFIVCDNCGMEQTLEFEHNVDVERKKVVCRNCHEELDRCKEGRWVPTYNGRKIRGYHINKLFCERTDLEELIENSKKIAQFELQEFYNSDLGLPYAAKGNRLSKGDIRSCIGEYTHPAVAEHCTMGVDVGSVLNIKISVIENGKRKACYIGTTSKFEDLEHLMNAYDVDVCVIDANPETRKAKEFQSKFAGRVYLAYYWPSDDRRQELLSIEEDEEEGHDVVKINRTQAGDYVVGQYQHRRVLLPIDVENIPYFLSQLTAPLRVVEKDRNGNDVAKYKEFNKADHYFHSDIYDFIAGKIKEEGVGAFYSGSCSGADRDVELVRSVSGAGVDRGRDTANMDW